MHFLISQNINEVGSGAPRCLISTARKTCITHQKAKQPKNVLTQKAKLRKHTTNKMPLSERVLRKFVSNLINWGSCFMLSNMARNEDSEFSHGKPPRVGRRPAAASHTPQRDQALVILAPPVLYHCPAVCFLLLFFYISNLLFRWVSNMKCSLKNIITSWTFTFDRFQWLGEPSKAQGWRSGTGNTLTCQKPRSGHRAELLLLQAMLGANPLPGLHSPWVHRRHWPRCPQPSRSLGASSPVCAEHFWGYVHRQE